MKGKCHGLSRSLIQSKGKISINWAPCLIINYNVLLQETFALKSRPSIPFFANMTGLSSAQVSLFLHMPLGPWLPVIRAEHHKTGLCPPEKLFINDCLCPPCPSTFLFQKCLTPVSWQQPQVLWKTHTKQFSSLNF